MQFSDQEQANSFIKRHRLKVTEVVSTVRGTRINVVGNVTVEDSNPPRTVRKALTLAVPPRA